MAIETVTLPIDSEAAQVFETVSSEEREKLGVLLSAWIKEYARSDKASLKRTMDEIGERAERRGLTPEILESLLRED